MPLKLVKLRTSPNLYIRGTIRGQPVFETTGTPERAAADAIRIQKEKELLDASVYGARVVKTFAEAAVSYMEQPGSSVNERRFIFPLVDALGKLPVAKLTQAVLDAHIRERYRKRSPATVLRNVITPVTAVLNHAARREWCSAPKFERPPQPRGRKRWATYEEAGALITVASPHLRRLILFLLFTGARMSEALDLEWSDVDTAERWAVFRDTKRGEDRGVALCGAALLGLGDHVSGRVFKTNRGHAYADKERRAGGQIKTAWRATCRRAAIKGLRPHDLRHTFSTWLTMAGVHEQVRDELMGHASTDMGRRYSHIPRAALTEAVDKLPEVVIIDGKHTVRQKADK